MSATRTGDFVIRPVQPGDERRLGEIAYLTGFFGDSASRYFPDPQLFADLWMRPYFARTAAGELLGVGYVAERHGVVEGYIIGATDQGRYLRAVLQTVLTRVLPRLLSGQVRQPGRIAAYFLRGLFFAAPHADWQVFPAHLHLNLIAGARGFGLSRVLLEAYLRRLSERGTRGIQLSTTSENEVALKVYRKQGFMLVAARPTRFWNPWLGHSTVYLTLARPLPLEKR